MSEARQDGSGCLLALCCAVAWALMLGRACDAETGEPRERTVPVLAKSHSTFLGYATGCFVVDPEPEYEVLCVQPPKVEYGFVSVGQAVKVTYKAGKYGLWDAKYVGVAR